MRRWSEVAERVAATTRTSEKTRLLAEYLAALDRDALAPAVVFFAGRAFAEADARSLGLGWATLADSVTRVAGVSRAELGAAYDRYSDLGRAVGDVLAAAADPPTPNGTEASASPTVPAASAPPASPAPPAPPAPPASPTVPEVAAAFAAIEAARGPAAKAAAF
jgi:DNA ligase N terminus